MIRDNTTSPALKSVWARHCSGFNLLFSSFTLARSTFNRNLASHPPSKPSKWPTIQGWYKRAPIEAQPQAKFYPPRQAAVPHQALLRHPSCTVACVLRQLCVWLLWPQYTSRSIRGIKEYLVYCGSAAARVDAPQFESFYTVPTIHSLWNNFFGELHLAYKFLFEFNRLSNLYNY